MQLLNVVERITKYFIVIAKCDYGALIIDTAGRGVDTGGIKGFTPPPPPKKMCLRLPAGDMHDEFDSPSTFVGACCPPCSG